MLHFKLGEVSIDLFRTAKHIRTTFPDGSFLPASPQDTPEYRATAEQLGYSDTWTLCWQHELTHTLYAQFKGLPYSQALFKAANRLAFTESDYIEEAAVLEIQRGYNDGALQHVQPQLYKKLKEVFDLILKP